MKDRLLYGIILTLVVAAAGLIYFGAQLISPEPEPPDSIVDESAQERPAPEFTAETLDGKEVTLSGFKGRPLYIYFGASW